MESARKVLLAEPNPRLAHRLAEELGALGLECEIVRDGAAALGSLARGDYALVILDLLLPKLSGAELARKIRQSPKTAQLLIELMSPPVKNPALVDQLCADFRLGPYFKMPFHFGLFRQSTEAYLKSGARGLSAVEQHRLAAGSRPPARAPRPAAAPAAAAPSPHTSPQVQSQPGPQAQAQAQTRAPAAKAPGSAAAPARSGPAINLQWGVGKALASFGHVLHKIRQQGFTGRARLEGAGALKMASFAAGLPVDAQALYPPGPFGEHVGERHGLAPAERAALAAGAKGPGEALLLLRMGALTWTGVLAEKRAYIAGQLAHCFCSKQGNAHLEALPQGPAESAASLLGLSAWVAAFAEGSRALAAQDEKALLEMEAQLAPRCLARTATFYELAHLIPADAKTAGLLGALTGAAPFAEILAKSPDRKAGLALCRALLWLGMLKVGAAPHADAPAPFPFRPPGAPEKPPRPAAGPAPPTPPAAAPEKAAGAHLLDLSSELSEELDEVVEGIRAGGAAPAAAPSAESRKLEDRLIDELERVKKSDYYRIFDARRNRFKFSDVKKRYFELQRSFSPDKFIMSPAEMMSKCEEYLEIISKAFETLSDVRKKMEYDDKLSKQKMMERDRESGGGLQAGVSFESGRALIKEGEYAAAERELRKALGLSPGNVEYEVYLARALYLNPATRKDMGAQVRVRQMLDRALVKSPKLAIAYGFRASIFLDQGKLDLAATDLAKTLRFDPQCLHAKGEQRRLAQLQQQKR